MERRERLTVEEAESSNINAWRLEAVETVETMMHEFYVPQVFMYRINEIWGHITSIESLLAHYSIATGYPPAPWVH